MKLYLWIIVLAAACAGCVAILPSDGVTVFDCARWAQGRAISRDIAQVCSAREDARRARYD